MTSMTTADWHLPYGANVVPGGVRFAVWAPNARLVEVELHGDGGPSTHPLSPGADGVHEGTVPGIGAGAHYKYRLDGGQGFPDPYSRFQPDGVHGPSEVIDPGAFAWHDRDWPGLAAEGLVIYECHVGTMTPEGTFDALIGQLDVLKRLGVSAIELMPVAACPGRWNWGYDGVALYAPSANYGRPDDLRRLVDAAHGIGLGVILDVVYNHLGPDGNYLRVYAGDYFTDRHKTPWGDALNYDGPNSAKVRDYAILNAGHWLTEYHLDGLRLDATDQIIDTGPVHLLQELTARVRAATSRSVVIVAEDARNDVKIARPAEDGGYGLTGVWADDFHHQVRVFLTGEREAYYADYEGTAADIAATIAGGFFYQGQPAPRAKKPRGTPVTGEPATAFVFCLQNHDQVGNRPYGERLHHDVAAGRYAVASALLLFAPETPLLFMGQEFAASASFLYFTDHEPELGRLVTEGRREEFKAFRAFQDPTLRHEIPDPQAAETFHRSKLNLAERQINAGIYALYQALLALRRDDPVLATQDRARTRAAAVGAQAIAVHRWHEHRHRLLIANAGPSVGILVKDQPLLAALPLANAEPLLSTAERRFGGGGDRAFVTDKGDGWRIEVPARTAVVFGFEEDERGPRTGA
ncbi:MAG: GH13_10 / GH13 / GH13_9 / GH13_36 / GH13_ 37 / CBM48 / GH13_8 / GH13_11 [uncultured Thermomicrobiales bacterium]|uniref:Malto-oligosyltrehalose trehalohydrolase n=1 Tax=uncultured Thermomicrobiales bacterium TaxID=1645740 RepID=A0A6J4V4L7_9BACT|nr:MAG: GH13_10 / GH13 / GH13_9 / GH13_36 / GH13_ 37 / CBM48 / GH13_8 / GH13_11 [uncultured Thermomicrobiales bacterium]